MKTDLYSIERTEEVFTNIKNKTKNIEKAVEPFCSHSIEELQNKLNAIGKAKMHVSMGYATFALYWMYLRAKGIDVENHPILKSQEDVKSYIEKVKMMNAKKQAIIAQLEEERQEDTSN